MTTLGDRADAPPLGYLRVLATDLDGTLTTEGPVSGQVLDALDDARSRGLRVILVTGRRLAELDDEHPGLREHVDTAVLENGAVLAGPRRVRLLAPPVRAELVEALTRGKVPHRLGDVVIECDGEDAHRVLDVLQDTGLDHQMVRNRAALMLLPPGITKGTGLIAALAEFGLHGHNTVGIGDAENDRTVVDACEIGVAVANAVPGLQECADIVLDAPAGEGVVELLRGPLLRPDTTPSSRRWQLPLGRRPDGTPMHLPASPSVGLITGDSRSGKSYLTGLVVERLAGLAYSTLVIDPEGDHASLARLPGITTVGGSLPAPDVLVDLVAHRCGTVVLDLSRQPLARAGPLRADAFAARLRGYLEQLAEALRDRRRRAGQPHWLVVDEADCLFAPGGPMLSVVLPGWGLCLSTYRPDRLAPQVSDAMQWTLRMDPAAPGTAALLTAGPPERFTLAARTTLHVRHREKYAHGSVLDDRRFIFRDGAGRAVGEAVNVDQFCAVLRQASLRVVAHHMRAKDFARWIGGVLGDADLATQVQAVERAIRHGGDPLRGRDTIVAWLERRYLR